MMYTERMDESLKPKSNRGGARPGAGHPKGLKTQRVIEREAVLRAFKDRVAKNADKLFNAQLDLAVGEKYLMVVTTRDKKRETSIVTDPEVIKKFLDEDEDSNIGEENEYFFMSTKAANNLALDSLLNRSFGKAQDKVDITTDGESIKETVPATEEMKAKFLKFMLEDTKG